MVIVVFQFSTNPNMSDEYFKEVELLNKEIKSEKGFISAERYISNTAKDSFCVYINMDEQKICRKLA